MFDLTPRIAPIRSSYIENRERCDRLFLLQDRFGIRRPGFNHALSFGTFTHRMLQVLFQGGTEAEAKSVTQNVYEEQKAKLAQAGTEPADLLKLEEALYKAMAAVIIFWESNPFPTDEYEILKDPDGKPMVEYMIKDEWSGVPVIVELDLVLLHKPTREIWFVDHKTTTKDLIPHLQALTISTQFQLYGRVLEQRLKQWYRGLHAGPHEAPYDFGTPPKVAGVIVNAISTPGIKYCGKDATFADYIRRLKKWYTDGEDKMLQSFPRFSDLDGLDRELDTKLSNYLIATKAPPDFLERFPRAGGYTCFAFNKTCPMLPFCTSQPSIWGSIFRTGKFEQGFREED